jgi:predicted ATPase
MARLERRWRSGDGWPKRLDWIEVKGIRGWQGQRFALSFPIMAVVGENGVGKSTILQCAASVYAAEGQAANKFATDFFLDTPWERIKGAEITYSLREGNHDRTGSIRKREDRWRKRPEQRQRNVEYIDLTRVQPVSARAGYAKIASIKNAEGEAIPFDNPRLSRMSRIMGRDYGSARTTVVTSNTARQIVVLEFSGSEYSGFHQGQGETTIAELLQFDLPMHSLVLIDEFESSLHPRAQRRLVRDLADLCRDRELQVVLTTHSPYVLEELPLEARCCVLQDEPTGDRRLVYGVSPEFAMSRMDEVAYPECEVYVEDSRAKTMLQEMLTVVDPNLRRRSVITPYGAASVGKALGQMVTESRFARPTCVYLDGDMDGSPGCYLLPGDEAPEVVVFDALKQTVFQGVDARVGRPYAEVVDACTKAMLTGNHHDWVTTAATEMTLGGDTLWQAMCAQWATAILDKDEAQRLVQPIADLIEGITPPVAAHQPAKPASSQATEMPTAAPPPPGVRSLFDDTEA